MVVRAPHTKRFKKGSKSAHPSDSYGRKTRKLTSKSKKKATRISKTRAKPILNSRGENLAKKYPNMSRDWLLRMQQG